MPKRSNALTFNCKLNKKYKDALKFKVPKKEKPEITRVMLIKRYSLKTVEYYEANNELTTLIQDFKREQNGEYDDDEDDGYASGVSTDCCGIDELVCHSIVNKIKEDTPVIRSLVAKHIHKLHNDDKRVIFVGLPIRKAGGGRSEYNFQKYQILRQILLDFGFKQASRRPYKNANSSNMLSVLVGQLP